jgi:ABC-type uncharacterized transport system ATPase subunit
MMVGEKVELNIGRTYPQNPTPRLVVKNLSCVNADGIKVIDNINFTANGGEILGIAGISGCGQKELLEAIDGAGEVEVMITLESCYENVYLKDKNLKTESGNGDFKEESDETYIMAKTSSNTQEGVIIKVYEPVVKGVAVVATGGESEKVKMAIIETVSAVFNIDSTNISVEKMKTERKE